MLNDLIQSNIIIKIIKLLTSTGESATYGFKYSISLVDIILIPIILSVITTFITIKIGQYFEDSKKNRDILFEVYMKLMEMEGYYMWIAEAELNQKPTPNDIEQKVFSLKYEIADLVRRGDVKDFDKVLETLFLEEYSHRNRYKDINLRINEIGEIVNPKYKKVMQDISKRNLQFFIKELK